MDMGLFTSKDGSDIWMQADAKGYNYPAFNIIDLHIIANNPKSKKNVANTESE